MIRIPNPTWSQPNNSDKFGSVWMTENISFDMEGYATLSPRMIRLYSDSDSNSFGFSTAIGRLADGEFFLTTDAANWRGDVTSIENTFSEDDGSNNPNPGFDGHGVFFQGLWHVSTSTAILSRPATGGSSQAWTSRVTGLTSGKQHQMAVFDSRVSLCVANGNVLKQYNSSYSNTTDLTIPTDYEIISMAYNNGRMGVITRLTNDGTYGQDREAKFFVWNGATTGSNGDASLGSDSGIAICAYKSSFLVLTRAGELLYWNGGGFEKVAAFPFYFTPRIFGDPTDNNALGNVYMKADGDIVHINIGINLNEYGVRQESTLENTPSGIWCFDPNVGLYHRYSLSNSPVYVQSMTEASVNTSTDVITVSGGTIPETGNPARLLSTPGIGGLTQGVVYYIIKESSTTFKLAATKEFAEAGVAIDLTSATTGTNYFWLYDVVDYGSQFFTNPGAITLTGNESLVYQDLIAGARLYDTDASTTVEVVSIGVPLLENAGCLITPKLFSQTVEESPKSLNIRYKPLSTGDKIIIKSRTKDIYDLPVSTPTDRATWTGKNQLYTSKDLSAAKTAIDAGDGIELKVISGVGAGDYVQVASIDEDSGTYTVTLKEDVIGATGGSGCDFILSHWNVERTITKNGRGFESIQPKAKSSKFVQYKVILKGYNIVVESIDFEGGAYQLLQ